MKSPPPVKRGKFEYDKDGLKYLHRTCAPPYEIESVVGLKNERPIGRHVAKHIKSKYPRDWWEAQIKLYGIKCSQFNIEAMKEILSRELGGLAVSPKVQQMEDSMAKEYQDLAKEYAAGNADETQKKMQKAKLGREEDQSRNALTDFSRPGHDAMRILSTTPEPTAKRTVMDEINQLHSKLLRTGPGDDIEGTWRIDCPEISSWYGDGHSMGRTGTDITWLIHPPQTSGSFVWGEISQVVVDGIVRIEWRDSDDWKGNTRSYVWRGRDNGTGEIQHSDEINRGVINFVSSHECLGTFACEFGGPYTFVGRKVSKGFPERTQSVAECQKEFRGYNWRRGNWESSARWGGCGDYDSEEDGEEDEGNEPEEVQMEERRKPKKVSMEARGLAPGMKNVEDGRRKPKRVSMEARGVAPGMNNAAEGNRKPKRVSMEARGVAPGMIEEGRKKPKRVSMEARRVAAL
jgi:hypothetical protein